MASQLLFMEEKLAAASSLVEDVEENSERRGAEKVKDDEAVSQNQSGFGRLFWRRQKVHVETCESTENDPIELEERGENMAGKRWAMALSYSRGQVHSKWFLKKQSVEVDLRRKMRMLESVFFVYAHSQDQSGGLNVAAMMMNSIKFRAFCRDYDFVGARKGVQSMAHLDNLYLKLTRVRLANQQSLKRLQKAARTVAMVSAIGSVSKKKKIKKKDEEEAGLRMNFDSFCLAVKTMSRRRYPRKERKKAFIQTAVDIIDNAPEEVISLIRSTGAMRSDGQGPRIGDLLVRKSVAVIEEGRDEVEEESEEEDEIVDLSEDSGSVWLEKLLSFLPISAVKQDDVSDEDDEEIPARRGKVSA